MPVVDLEGLEELAELGKCFAETKEIMKGLTLAGRNQNLEIQFMNNEGNFTTEDMTREAVKDAES